MRLGKVAVENDAEYKSWINSDPRAELEDAEMMVEPEGANKDWVFDEGTILVSNHEGLGRNMSMNEPDVMEFVDCRNENEAKRKMNFKDDQGAELEVKKKRKK